MAKDFPTIKLREMIVDNTCMQLASHPEQFDVMVCAAPGEPVLCFNHNIGSP